MSVAAVPRTAQPAGDRLGEFLVRQGAITHEQLESALRVQRKHNNKHRLGEILVAQKVLTQKTLQEVLEAQKRLRLKNATTSQVTLPPLPESIATIAVVDGPIVYIAHGQQGNPAFQSWLHGARRDLGGEITVEPCDMPHIAQLRAALDTSTTGGVANLPVIRQIRRIFADAVEREASDIHFTLYENNGNGYLDIQYRIKGDITAITQLPEAVGAQMVNALFQGMASVSDAQITDNDDQNAIITNPLLLRGDSGRDLGLGGVRLAKSRLVHGKGVAARLLFKHAGQTGKGTAEESRSVLDHLGYSPRQINILNRLARQTIGINPFTGPTGSGKSTTLAAQIRDIRINRPGLRILTIEDPVEIEFNDSNIWQFYLANANTDEEKSALFATKVKASLREDPDIIMVGEIRGLETAREAVNAAITGHQIWTTLHVSDPFMIATRLVLMGLDPFYLRDPQLLTSLIAQRLVKTLCPHCAIPLIGNEDRLSSMLIGNLQTWTQNGPFPDLSRVRLRGPGCPHCRHQGIKGRTVISQVIPTDEELLGWMLDQGAAVSRRQYMARANAEIDIVTHGILKILVGEIDPHSFIEAGLTMATTDTIPPRPVGLRPLTMEDV